MKSGCNTGSGLRKGAWTAEEDMLLKNCIEKYGEGKWHLVPPKAGLNRCRKSCRLRWLNYLRPNIKRGYFEEDEVDLILRLHKLLGNRWSLIAGRIPGRTSNDVKNYWNTHLGSHAKQQKKKLQDVESSQNTMVTVIKPQPRTFSKTKNRLNSDNQIKEAHEEGSLLRSSNDTGNDGLNTSLGLISSIPVALDDKINKFWEELLDDRGKKIEGEVGRSLGGFPAEGGALNVLEQEDDQNSFFNIPMDEVMWDFLDSEQL